MKRVLNYLSNVNKELGKVRWSTKKELVTYSIATMIFIVVFALFFMATDYVLLFLRGLV